MSKKLLLKNTPGFDEFIIKAYCEDKRSMKDIADEVGCSAAAIHGHIHRLNIPPRKRNDYEPTEKCREAWREIGRRSKGRKASDETKKKLSEFRKGKRLRDDYEFGGHEKKRNDGYVCVYVPDHPSATADGMVMKHRLIMEHEIGRYLTNNEVVHHKNKIRDDNRLENLQLMTAHDHMSMHMKERYAERRNQSC